MLKRYLRFDLGTSYFYQKSVWGLIVEKLPVSMSLGIWSFLIVYSVSIPLGIAKAVRDGSRFDFWTSTLILVGYAIPGFVLGVALLVLFGGGSFWALFPLARADLGRLGRTQPHRQGARLLLAPGHAARLPDRSAASR